MPDIKFSKVLQQSVFLKKHSYFLTASRSQFTVGAVSAHIHVSFQTLSGPIDRLTGEVAKTIVPVLARHATVGAKEIGSTGNLERSIEHDSPKEPVEFCDGCGRS